MAYQGWLIKVGNYVIPDSIIKANSYSPYKNSQDLGSYRDADGVLHRTSLKHKPNKVEFEIIPMMTNVTFSELMRNIRANYVDPVEKSANVTMYIPETDSYETQLMYMPDVKPTIYGTYGGKIHYNSIRIAFIGY